MNTSKHFYFARETYPWKQLLLLVMGAACGHILANSLYGWLRPGLGLWFCMMCFVILTVSLKFLHARRNKHHGVLIFGLSAFLGVSGLAIEGHHLLDHWLKDHKYSPLWPLVLLVPLWIVVLKAKHDMAAEQSIPRLLAREPAREYSKKHPVRGLVLFISPPTSIPKISGPVGGQWKIDFDYSTPTSKRVLSLETEPNRTIEAVNSAIEAMKVLGFHNWEPLVQAIAPHIRNLEQVWILGSPQADGTIPEPMSYPEKANPKFGSAAYLPLAEQFLRGYLPDKARIHRGYPVDFETYTDLHGILTQHILPHMDGIPGNAIAIDITGGQKPCSIAAAFLTQDREAVIQYVQTNGESRLPQPISEDAQKFPLLPANIRQPWIYDIRLDQPAAVEG